MPRNKRTFNKSAFVRGLPNIPASEVVAKARTQGIELTDKYVYNIRAKAKAAGGKVPGRPGRPPGRPKSAASGGEGSAAQQFAELALQVGFDRSAAILVQLRDAVAGVALD